MGAQNWPELYADYLKSQQWADKRDRVLRRANYHCEGCAQRPATDAHHLTYEHVTQEFLFELVALCRRAGRDEEQVLCASGGIEQRTAWSSTARDGSRFGLDESVDLSTLTSWPTRKNQPRTAIDASSVSA